MKKLLRVKKADDILSIYRDTPVASLLGFHNLAWTCRGFSSAELLIITCMDHRIALRMPPNFAYVLRAAGANSRHLLSSVCHAVAVGGAKAACVIGHSDCAMTNVQTQRDQFVRGLMTHAGWDETSAENRFESLVETYGMHNAVDFARDEAQRLSERFPGLLVAPLFYCTEDGALLQILRSKEERDA